MTDEAKQGSRCPTCKCDPVYLCHHICADPWHAAEAPVAPTPIEHHTEILSPPLQWRPEDMRDHHLSGEQDEKEKFDPRCPKCVAHWAKTGKMKAK